MNGGVDVSESGTKATITVPHLLRIYRRDLYQNQSYGPRTELACLQSAERDRLADQKWAANTAAEIIAEVTAQYQPEWEAAMARFDAAMLAASGNRWPAHLTDAEKADAERRGI